MTADREMKRRKLMLKRIHESINLESTDRNPGLTVSFSSLDERRSPDKRIKQFHWNKASK